MDRGSRSYGTRSVPTTINIYLFLEVTIVWKDGRGVRKGRKGEKGVAPQKRS